MGHRDADTARTDPWFETMFASAPVAMAFLDRDLRYLRVNDQLARMNGRSAAEHLGRTIFEVVPDVAAHAAPLLRQVVDTGEALLGLEITGETAAQPGVVRRWLEDVYPVRNHMGGVCGVAVRVEDITAQRRAEAEAGLAARWDRERRYNRGLIEASVDGLLTVDLHGIVSDVNGRTCQMTGLSDSEIIGMPFAACFTDPAAARAGVDQTLREGVVTDCVLTLVSRTGEGIPVSVNASVFRDPAGRVKGVFASARDITEQVRAARQLTRLTDLLNRTQEISRTGGWDYDVATDRLSWTDEVYRIYGLKRTDGPPDVDEAVAAFDADSKPVLAAAFQRLVADGEAYDLELGLIRADGQRIWVRTIGQPELKDGQIVRVGGNIVDITARKQAEEQLRHERDLYNATLDIAGAVIVVVDADARLLRFNRQAELLTGYREAEVLGRDPYEFLIPPEERSAVAANLQPVSPGQLVHQENHWMHRDGHRRLIHWSNAGLFDSQERLTHLIAVGIDVTDQRRLERQLRARADQAAIFASFAEGLATPGPEPGGVLERVTVQVAEFVGDTCGVFVVGEDGNTLSNLAWHSRRPEAVEFARRLVAARPYTIDTGPAVEVFRTGRTVVFSEDDKASLREQLAPEYRPLMDEFGAACAVYVPLRAAGNTLGVVVTYRFAGPDYTDDEVGFLEEFAARASLAYENARQGAERRRSQELLDAVFQMLPDLICIAGADGYFRVLNPAWEHTLGWTVDELCAQPYLDFVHPDDRLQTLAEHDRQTQHGEPVVTFENRYRCRDGSYRWLQWNSLPLAERGLLIANARDVTDRKQVEEALADSNRELERRSEELARSNRDLEQFAYIASHDLQEPLRMVSSYTSLLAEDLGDRLDETAARHLHYARDGAVRMQQLVNDLLRFSRVSRGADGDRERVDCDRLVAAVIVDLQEAIVPAGATVSHERLPTVTGVETELRQLFTNLIGNAVKFHGSEPVRVLVRAEHSDAMWRFAVVDNGIGVDPAQAERVFEVFKRLHARGRYPGTGIGLAICKKVVEHHGGRIWVESTPGAGATFRFTLPAAVVEEAAP